MMKRLAGYLPVLMLLAAITCAAQPPEHSITSVRVPNAAILAQTRLDDGTHLAAGIVMNRTSWLFIDPGSTSARIVQQTNNSSSWIHRATDVMMSSGAVLSVASNNTHQGLAHGIQVCRYVPGERGASLSVLDAIPDGWALMKDGTLCLVRSTYDGLSLFRYDHNRSQVVPGITRIPLLKGFKAELVALTNGDVLLTAQRDSTIRIARFTSDLQLKWAKEIRIHMAGPLGVGFRILVAGEKSDGSILFVHTEGRPTYVIHHLDSNGTPITSRVLTTPWLSSAVRRIAEDGSGGVVMVAYETGSKNEPGTFRLAPDLSTAQIFRHRAFIRPGSNLTNMTIEHAPPGRIRVTGSYGAMSADSVSVASVEWGVGGELPCDIVPYTTHLTTVSTTVENITGFASNGTIPNGLILEQGYLSVDDEYRVAADTYPCTSIIGTTSSTTVLSGASRELGLDERIVSSAVSPYDSTRTSIAVVSATPLGVLKLHAGKHTADDLAYESSTVDVTGSDLETMELFPTSSGSFQLRTHLIARDSLQILSLTLFADGNGPAFVQRTMLPAPPRARLLRQAWYNHPVFASADSIFFYRSDSRITAVPSFGETARVAGFETVLDNPPRIITPMSDSCSILTLTDVASVQCAFGGIHQYFALRLAGAKRRIAIVKQEFTGVRPIPGKVRTIVLPDDVVDSVYSIEVTAGASFNQATSNEELLVLGRVDDDVCVIRIQLATGLTTYRRIKHEGMRLEPICIQRLAGGDKLLWCDGIVGRKRSIVGIPTNFFGQAACDDGWTKVLNVDSSTSFFGSIRTVSASNYVVVGRELDVPKITYPTLLLDRFMLCDTVATSVMDVNSRDTSDSGIYPLVQERIPDAFIPSTARTLIVRDIQGRILMSVHSDTRIQNVSTTDLVPGVYVMIMEHETGKITTQPFMVMQR